MVILSVAALGLQTFVVFVVVTLPPLLSTVTISVVRRDLHRRLIVLDVVLVFSGVDAGQRQHNDCDL